MNRYLRTQNKSIYDEKSMIVTKVVGSIAEKGTDLKGKRLSSPHRFIYKSIINVKGMNVISHRLRPMLINR
jgi:hypothetical protein